MANLGFTFNAHNVKPATGSSPLPLDWYNVMITDSEIKPVKDKPQNHRLVLSLKVMDGHYQGRTITTGINLWNDNPQTAEIAQGELSAICHATGVFEVSDTSRLHGIPLMVRVIEKPPEGQYDAGNDVKGWAKLGEKDSQNGRGVVLQPKASAPPATAGQPSATATPGGTYAPPWGGQPAPAAPAYSPPPAAAPAPAPTYAPPQPAYAPPPPAGHGAPPPPPGHGAPPPPPGQPAAPVAPTTPPWVR